METNRRKFRPWIPVALFALPGSVGFANTPPTGLRVYAEIWNPTKVDGESLKTLENNPTLLSDTLASAWQAFANWYQNTVPAKLHQQDFLHSVDPNIPPGITLYSRGKDMTQPPSLGLAPNPDLALTPGGTNGFTAVFHVPSSSISLCSTTPDVGGISLGKWADPCLSASLDLDVTMTISISDSPGHFLQVTNAAISARNFQYTNENWSAEAGVVATDLIAFFGGPDYQKMLINIVDSQRLDLTNRLQAPVDALNSQIQSYEQTARTQINKALAPAASLDSLVHVALWEQNAAGSQELTVLLAPPLTGITLNPSQQVGEFSGTLNFDASVATPPASCASINAAQFSARAQTGPRPVLSIDAQGRVMYGNAPTQQLAPSFLGGPVQGRQCSYTLGHLALGLPNVIDLDSNQPGSASSIHRFSTLDIKPDQWANPVVVGPYGIVISTGSATNRLVAEATGREPVASEEGADPGSSLTPATAALLRQRLDKPLNLIASADDTNRAGAMQASAPGLSNVSQAAVRQPAAAAPTQSDSQQAAPISWGARPDPLQTVAKSTGASVSPAAARGLGSVLGSAPSPPHQQSLQRSLPATGNPPSSFVQ